MATARTVWTFDRRSTEAPVAATGDATAALSGARARRVRNA
jgi:hypothetical protein